MTQNNLQVGQYTVAAPLSHYHPSPNPPQPMGRGAARRGASGGLQRAVSHLESHLKATRQDALQLATAVVRLEKEKAALQNSLKQQSAHGLQQTWPSRTGECIESFGWVGS